jgi:hypothetical protein
MAGILSFLLLLQNVQSTETLRFAHVAEQGYDTSCGLSALSDLVSRYWNCPVSKAVTTYAPIVIHFADQEGHFVLCLSANLIFTFF